MKRWGTWLAIFWCGGVWAMGGTTPVDTAAKVTTLSKKVSDEQGSIPYVVALPAGYRADTSWPVIVSLHGSGEAGDDNVAQTEQGIWPLVLENPERFPAIVIMPQIPKGAEWTDARMSRLALAALRDTQRDFAIDARRVYLTGYAGGGYGAFKIGAENPALFAAIIPICGGGDHAMAKALREMPIWIFHGALDLTVSVEESRRMVSDLQDVSNSFMLYTEYDLGFHAVWDRAYGDPVVIQWLFRQRQISSE